MKKVIVGIIPSVLLLIIFSVQTVWAVSDCSLFIYPKQIPAGAVCRIGSGQKLFSSSDIEVGQTETGPWLLCSVCGQPHDLYGFEGPIWIRAPWGASFFTEGPASPTVSPGVLSTANSTVDQIQPSRAFVSTLHTVYNKILGRPTLALELAVSSIIIVLILVFSRLMLSKRLRKAK
ncbi:MAG: hypothetical protein ACOX50_03970 [Patescibacteria group bacterium]|jgi:hypothetical protein